MISFFWETWDYIISESKSMRGYDYFSSSSVLSIWSLMNKREEKRRGVFFLLFVVMVIGVS